MPSPDKNSVDVPIQVFGGRVTQFDPQNLPVGASPFNQDVSFSGQNPSGTGMVTGVATRPGLSSFYPAFAGNPTVNYVRTFEDTLGNFRQLILDGLGVLHQEFPAATLSTIGNVVAASFAQSDTLNGREWQAIGDGQFGIDIPRQWDGTNFDRASQCGPGAPPAVIDESVSGTIVASPNGLQQISSGITTLSEIGNIVTVSGPGTATLRTGDTVIITGATVAGYNGTWAVGNIISSTAFQYISTVTGLATDNSGSGSLATGITKVVFTASISFSAGATMTIAGAGVAGYDGTWQIRLGGTGTTFFIAVTTLSLANSGGGTGTAAGNISAGVHQVSVCFVTRQNYITKPSPYTSWTAGGSKRAIVSNIPTGPANITQRILIFTPVITAPATTGPFFYFPNTVATPTAGIFPTMVINDNTTTTYAIDFLDAVLENATAATNLFNLLELGECSGMAAYSNRTSWTGERNKVPNFVNVTFDGGFSQFNNLPLGWIPDPTNSGGGAGDYTNPYWGGDYTITGDGATAIRGKIFQTAYQDYLGVPIIFSATAYSIRVRVAKNNILAAGTLHINLQSTSGGFTTVGISLAAGAVTTSYAEYTAVLTAAIASPESDLQLQVYADGTPTNGGIFYVDCVEIYPTQQANNRTRVRFSYAGQPEAFDQLTGFLDVGVDNGQAIRCSFRLLDNKLYILKERSMYVTNDDGQNEPSLWVVNTVSDTVGTPSVHGAAVGESWAIIAAHDGVYIFWGSEPVKISQEIQPDWNTINWSAASAIYCAVDTFNKRIHIGAPVGISTIPNVEFVCDYSQLANSEGATSAEDIVSHPQAYYSAYQPTKVLAPGKARKWTVWNLNGGQGANCAVVMVRQDGSYHLIRGNAIGNGKVYDQLATQLSDDGTAINSQYQTAFIPEIEMEQQLQLGSHRKLFKYLTGYSIGVGTMTWTMFGAQNQRAKSLSNLTLQNPAHWDWEKNTNFVGERASYLFGTDAVGSWFETTRLAATVQRELFTPVRGVA
jgi:hypothetical protein